ncbi:MAG: hypothetical protein WCX84_09675, partial [Syntrophales bacterium]
PPLPERRRFLEDAYQTITVESRLTTIGRGEKLELGTTRHSMYKRAFSDHGGQLPVFSMMRIPFNRGDIY